MKTNRFAAFLAVFLFAACNLPGADATPQPEPEPKITPVVVQAQVVFNNVSFLIPVTLGTGASAATTTDVELPYINPSFGPMPEHIVFTIEQFTYVRDHLNARIMVFPAAEYAQYSEITAGVLSALQTDQFQDGQALPRELALSDFYAQVKTLNFQNGHGLRYLTQINQDYLPINNQDIFYYYVGLSEDNAYLVSAVLPVQSSILAADSLVNSPDPAEGVPFDENNFAVYPQYLRDVAQKINSLEPGSFTPALTTLDELIQSIKITP